jgi:hypothetical protein
MTEKTINDSEIEYKLMAYGSHKTTPLLKITNSQKLINQKVIKSKLMSFLYHIFLSNLNTTQINSKIIIFKKLSSHTN